jgi:glycosyltransferase involved in cell wall biosynthesis
MPLTYSRLVGTPMVTTVHGFSSPAILPVYQRYDDVAHYVSISDADRSPLLHYAATIHHGIELDRFTFAPEPGAYLLFLGRIHPDKGTHSAIHVARAAGIPLVIAGIVQDHDYFEAMVRPHVDGREVSYLGPVGPTQRDAILGGAMALLHLVDFDEPFGLSVVEALAAGTPVIASPRGSLPEIVRPAVTGFLVTDHADAVRAVTRLAEIDRAVCRADVETRFGHHRMIEDYLALFDRVCAGSSPVRD